MTVLLPNNSVQSENVAEMTLNKTEVGHVRDAYRRRGIAQQLLANAAAWAKSHGLNQLRLMVADQNPDARAAFEKSGFRPTYQEMVLPL